MSLKDIPLLCKGPECPDYYLTDNGMQAYAQESVYSLFSSYLM